MTALNQALICQQLKQPHLEVEVFDSLTSTNDYLQQFITETTPRVCIAEQQTAGRGRLQRSWHSPKQQNLYLSILYPLQGKLSALSSLSLVISLSVCKTLNELFHLPFSVKWPNDVLYTGKKLAGNLVEITSSSANQHQAIIGVGINVNMTEAPGLDTPWTSLKMISHQDQDRNLIATTLLKNIFHDLEKFQQEGLTAFLIAWQKHDALANKPIQLKVGDQTIEGIALGINEQGHLRLQLANKKEQTFASGDTQVKV